MTHRPNSAVRYPRRARRTRTRSGNDDEHRRLWSGTCGLDWGTWLVPSIAGLRIPTLRVNENRQALAIIHASDQIDQMFAWDRGRSILQIHSLPDRVKGCLWTVPLPRL